MTSSQLTTLIAATPAVFMIRSCRSPAARTRHTGRLPPKTRRTLQEVAEPEPVDAQPRPCGTLPSAYQDILAVLTRTEGGLRAKELCRALDIGDQPRHTEAMRAKLKRLVGRDILSEPEPELFIMNRRES
ncbi:hypothetical protein E1281_15120 [Actinomadura sp. KC345]|uniref:hypothetical protein n=1 Tax=Actinomadura sp. KC345 TaxID=2530371 RepID=UPI0010502FF9|nr:hypothetical protein [Actinomadura sp. KC345]TDC54893.1 hypothetical protein E1281_15120 [Actinomadura sp. KC345]